MQRVLERLVEKGKVVAKRAYADWGRFSEYTTPLHELGIELMEIPERGMTGKNSADIRLVVDAMELSYAKEHIDTFVIVSGDSRLHAARAAAQGERQDRHRPRHEGLHVRPARGELRRVHLLRGHRRAPPAHPTLGETVPRKQAPGVQAALRDDRGAAARERRRHALARWSRTR